MVERHDLRSQQLAEQLTEQTCFFTAEKRQWDTEVSSLLSEKEALHTELQGLHAHITGAMHQERMRRCAAACSSIDGCFQRARRARMRFCLHHMQQVRVRRVAAMHIDTAKQAGALATLRAANHMLLQAKSWGFHVWLSAASTSSVVHHMKEVWAARELRNVTLLNCMRHYQAWQGRAQAKRAVRQKVLLLGRWMHRALGRWACTVWQGEVQNRKLRTANRGVAGREKRARWRGAMTMCASTMLQRTSHRTRVLVHRWVAGVWPITGTPAGDNRALLSALSVANSRTMQGVALGAILRSWMRPELQAQAQAVAGWGANMAAHKMAYSLDVEHLEQMAAVSSRHSEQLGLREAALRVEMEKALERLRVEMDTQARMQEDSLLHRLGEVQRELNAKELMLSQLREAREGERVLYVEHIEEERQRTDETITRESTQAGHGTTSPRVHPGWPWHHESTSPRVHPGWPWHHELTCVGHHITLSEHACMAQL